jgi:hypothetical protein
MRTQYENDALNKLINIEIIIQDIKDYLSKDEELALMIGIELEAIHTSVKELDAVLIRRLLEKISETGNQVKGVA